MTDETPEQKLRTAVMSAWPSITKWDAALDRLCTERYLAGAVAWLKACQGAHADLDAFATTFLDKLAEAEAEYAACVAALREAK